MCVCVCVYVCVCVCVCTLFIKGAAGDNILYQSSEPLCREYCKWPNKNTGRDKWREDINDKSCCIKVEEHLIQSEPVL